jgi:hypothetical protein
MSTGDPKSGIGPQDNVPQEQVQTNPNWDTGGEKTPSREQQDGYWEQVSDEHAHAGEATPTTGLPNAHAPSVTGQHDHHPSTYGSMEHGQPASGAMTNPEKTVDADEKL